MAASSASGRTLSSLCHCSDRPAVHVHCFCINCKGKAVNYRTQRAHLDSATFCGAGRADEQASELEFDIETEPMRGEDSPIGSGLEDEDVSDCSAGDGSSSGEDLEDNARSNISTEEQKLKYAIVKSIFEAIELSTKTGSSLGTFADLLCYARRMYCRGKDIDEEDLPVKCSWPKDWETAQKYLKDVGYEDAHEYFICLSAMHKQHWDIMQSASSKCRFCGEGGTIKYYYLGLNSKVKQWTEDPDMCSKMTAHWSEKEHWINGNVDGWEIKKEVWDGARFAELAWFWDPDKRWCLPARCIRDGCKNVFSAEDILQSSDQPDGSKELYCNCCYTRFLHYPKYSNGDPRNVAYIGHWDGFQPFGRKSRSTGAIEVSVATMAKEERLQTGEVYTVGFVPSYDLPDARPNSIDPFLEPLVSDIEKGFIEAARNKSKVKVPAQPKTDSSSSNAPQPTDVASSQEPEEDYYARFEAEQQWQEDIWRANRTVKQPQINDSSTDTSPAVPSVPVG